MRSPAPGQSARVGRSAPIRQPQQRASCPTRSARRSSTISPPRAGRGSTPSSTGCPARETPSPVRLEERRSLPRPRRQRGAQPLGLDDGALDHEARRLRLGDEARRRARHRGSATVRQRGRRGSRRCGRSRRAGAMGAGDEGAEPLDAVDEAVGDEEVERPVDDRRLAPEPRRRQPLEELVGVIARCDSSSVSSTKARAGVSRSSPRRAHRLGGRERSPRQRPWSWGAKARCGSLDGVMCYTITDLDPERNGRLGTGPRPQGARGA